MVGQQLVIDESKQRPIVSGWYCTEDGRTTSVAHWLDEEDFSNNGGVMNHETLDSIQKRTKPFTVDYAGFGWLLIQKGVFEDFDENGRKDRVSLVCSKDAGLLSLVMYRICVAKMSRSVSMPKEAVLRYGADPRIRVGHEKTKVI